jgi:hypothetical protein
MNKNIYDVCEQDLIDETQYENHELFDTLKYLIRILLLNIEKICQDDWLFFIKLNLFKDYFKNNLIESILLISKNIIIFEKEILNFDETYFLENKEKIDNSLSELLTNIWKNNLSNHNKKIIWIQIINILVLSKKYIKYIS